jgi:hypothetical protein
VGSGGVTLTAVDNAPALLQLVTRWLTPELGSVDGTPLG